MRTKIPRGAVFTVLLTLTLALAAPTAFGSTLTNPGCDVAPVAPPCNDVISSLGQFIVLVTNPAVIAALGVSKPAGYDPATHIFVSPTLFDSSTVVERSNNFTDNGAQPAQTVGATGTFGGQSITALTGITNSSFVAGGVPSGFPSGNDAVYTDVANLHLTGSGFSVSAGASASGTSVASSTDLGKVEAQGAGSDFPASSFFDIFVDITVPGLGSIHNPGANPMIVQSTIPANGSLPPKVIYVHGMSSVVPLLFDANGPGNSWLAGDTLGTVVLTGHGASYMNSAQDMASFTQSMIQLVQNDNLSNNPINGLTPQQQQAAIMAISQLAAPEPSSVVILLGGLALLAWRAKRRCF
jgi:hypothetical protein